MEVGRYIEEEAKGKVRKIENMMSRVRQQEVFKTI